MISHLMDRRYQIIGKKNSILFCRCWPRTTSVVALEQVIGRPVMTIISVNTAILLQICFRLQYKESIISRLF